MDAMKMGLDRPAIKRISSALTVLFPDFNGRAFTRAANNAVQALELKQRVHALIGLMHHYLPNDFPLVAKALTDLPTIWDYGEEKDAKRSFASWPIIDYVAAHGIQHPDIALPLLARLTHLHTAEFAIRPFIQQHPASTFTYLESWLDHESEHVRRLVSEGTRPRLPWAMQLKNYINDPRPLLPLLDQLKSDESLYVRRSVANNLNDIAKDHPELVIKECRRYKKTTSADIDWVIKQACRTLIKQGRADVFSLLNYSAKPAVSDCKLRLKNQSVAMGGSLSFCFTAKSTKTKQRWVVDYAIYFLRANGQHHKKVFKLKNLELDAQKSVTINKHHSFAPISTRRYYCGAHRVVIQINGQEVASHDFALVNGK